MASAFEPFDAELEAIEQALGRLKPAAGRIDRDQIMFRAGRASAHKRQNLWPALAASLALVAVGEAIWLPRQAVPLVVERESSRPGTELTHAPRPSAAPIEPQGNVTPLPGEEVASMFFEELALGRTDQERLANQVLRYGLDGLSGNGPAPLPGPAPSASANEAIRLELLGILNSGGSS